MRKSIAAFALGLVAAVVVACGGAPTSDDTDGEHGAVTSLTVTPAQSEHTIANGVLPTQDFTAELTYADGTTEDVTAQTAFGVDSNIGAFSTHTLTMGAAGKGMVTAVYGETTGAAQVIVRLSDVRVADGVDPGVPAMFDMATPDAARAPTVLYPALDVVMPRNLGDFEVHWNDASTNNVYELSLRTELTEVKVYVPGGNGILNGPNPSWAAFAAQEWMDAVGGGTSVSYMVRGLDTANPATVGATDARTVTLTNEALEGGIYYWASKDPTNTYPEGIWRHDMSKPGEPAEEFYTKTQSHGRCVACHALARRHEDGDHLRWRRPTGVGRRCRDPDRDARRGRQLELRDVHARHHEAHRRVRRHDDHGARRVDAADRRDDAGHRAGSGLAPRPLGRRHEARLHAQLGRRGLQLRQWHDLDAHLRPGHEHVWRRDPAGDGRRQQLLPVVVSGRSVIMFNRSTNPNQSSYNNTNADLWVVKADGSMPPVPFMAANGAGGLANAWGRWAPFAQTVGPNREPIFWVTVSSQRQFGVRLAAGQPQIWMTPFYPSRAASSADPSAPVFRLPFQNLATNNHIAQWTEKVIVLGRAAK